MADKPRVGISSCLLGNKVRYDGKHQRNDIIIEVLADHIELIAICPETGIGLPVPRPPIHLVRFKSEIHAIGVEDNNLDVTNELITYSNTIFQQYQDLSGFIFKSRSPSCGVHDTPIVNSSNEQIDTGAGLFAHTLIQLNPTLPIEDETRLQDKESLNVFLKRVLSFANLESG